MHTSKKIFIASTAFLAVILIFWGIYSLSFRTSTSPDEESAANDIISEKEIEEQAQKNSAKIQAIFDEPVLTATLTADQQNILYYAKEAGKIYQTALDGAGKKDFSSLGLANAVSLAWSPGKTKAVIGFPRGNFSLFDFEKNLETPLKSNLDTVVWQGNSKILYKYYSAGTKERTLNVADPDGKNWSNIASLNYKKMDFAPVPKTGLVSFWNSPDAFAETLLQTIAAIGGEKKTIFSGKFGADYLWSPDGNRLLISHADQKNGGKMQLAVANANGGEYKNLEIPTFISKCVWSSNGEIVFYALPGNIPDDSILPNDYLENKFQTKDTFWKLDIVTGKQERILDLQDLQKIDAAFDATNLFLNQDESALFFINRVDSKLYRIDL